MAKRVRELDAVAARVTAMEEKLQRRLDKHDEIVSLYLTQILHQADGLDFSIPPVVTGGYGGMGMGLGGGMSGEEGMGPGGRHGGRGRHARYGRHWFGRNGRWLGRNDGWLEKV
jgi:hypothetical protein